MKRPLTLSLILFSILVTAAEAEPAAERAKRTWTTRDRKFKVEAVLVDFDDKKVRLRRGDGKLLSVDLKKLSRADRKYVDAQRAAVAKKPDATDKPADAKPARDTTAADQKALQGRWQMIYIERD
ncbi:MAG: hypothetical protein IID44_22080, partial [Planctomycetes bacterium]|nr:hypothetical protein [Planctomycetota bacterium]